MEDEDNFFCGNGDASQWILLPRPISAMESQLRYWETNTPWMKR